MGNAHAFLRRPDVLKLNPQYDTDKCGFELKIEQHNKDVVKYSGYSFRDKEFRIEFK